MELAKTTTLVAQYPINSVKKDHFPKTRKEAIIEAELDSINVDVDERHYHTLEKLQQMKDKSMVYSSVKFNHIYFKINLSTGSRVKEIDFKNSVIL